MLLKIDFESDIPIYVQFKRQIIQGIARGELQEGDSLPSVRQMAEDIGINMHTVNKAYNMLKVDGFVTIDRRKGAIINKMPAPISEELKESLREDIDSIVAEFYCRGVMEEEFLNICKDIYTRYRKD